METRQNIEVRVPTTVGGFITPEKTFYTLKTIPGTWITAYIDHPELFFSRESSYVDTIKALLDSGI